MSAKTSGGRLTEQIIALVDPETKATIERIRDAARTSAGAVIRDALARGLPLTERAAQKGRLHS
jgi:hypothetical protein